LAIANISSNILGFFMVSLWIKDESLLEEHDNRLVVNLANSLWIKDEFLGFLLQKHWINSQRDSPFF
jgi:hypothetical protein